MPVAQVADAGVFRSHRSKRGPSRRPWRRHGYRQCGSMASRRIRVPDRGQSNRRFPEETAGRPPLIDRGLARRSRSTRRRLRLPAPSAGCRRSDRTASASAAGAVRSCSSTNRSLRQHAGQANKTVVDALAAERAAEGCRVAAGRNVVRQFPLVLEIVLVDQ